MKKKYRTFDNAPLSIIDEKALSQLEELKVECSCGHKTIMPVYLDTTICSYCKKRIKNNTKLYFMYKLRKELKNSGK